MSGRSIVVVMFLALALSIAAVPANAGEESGTVTLYMEEHIVIPINITPAADNNVRMDIQVTDGVPVNVYYLIDVQYLECSDPKQDEFRYVEEYSMLNTMSFRKTVQPFEINSNYLIIETTGLSGMDFSNVEYELEWWEEDDEDDYFCEVAALVLAVGAGAGILIWWRMRGGGTAPEPRSDAAPVLDPGDMTEPGR
jgi:hypothetical protein